LTDLFTKKLEYIAENLIPDHITDKYPKYLDFIKVYLRYLDQNQLNKSLYITDNNDTDTVFTELLDDYLNNYFKDVVNLDKYGLTDDNKRIYLALHKLITNLKGNKQVFDFLFKSLTDFEIVDDGSEIGSLDIAYSETEGVDYTYTFQADVEYELIRDLVERVHPAGFLAQISLATLIFSDDISVSDALEVAYQIFYYYNGNQTYDGSFTYNSEDEIILGDV